MNLRWAAVFHVIRERLGVRTSLFNLAAFVALSLLTLAAEIGGVALVLELVTGVNYLIFVPFVGAAVWLVVWRLKFTIMENLFGLLGLCLVVFIVALFVLPTDWGSLWNGAIHPSVPAAGGGAPVLTAILCGPMAFGPRIGGLPGRWWAAIGRRLRPRDGPRPNRIPLQQVDHVDRREMRLSVSRDQIDADRLRDWVRDHVIGPIPGSST